MKKLLVVGVIASLVLVMTGCEDLPGVLTVTKNLNVLVKGKTKSIEVGAHKTSLDFKKNKVVATIEAAAGKLKVELQVAEGSQIPSNGNFELKSAQSGQPFDVLGSVETHVTESARKVGYESCERQSYEVICGKTGCQTVPVIRHGQRSIEYFDRTTDQRMNFSMTETGNAKVNYADFNGQVQYLERIKTREGACF